jgi:predicted esterase/acyl carrier protein
MYGATEAGCTYFVVGSGEEEKLRPFPEGVPAGIPQAYVDVWIMEASVDGADSAVGEAYVDGAVGEGGLTVSSHRLNPVPTGTVGEICFGGGGEGFLARGYWQNEQLTAEKFVQTAEYGRLYRTGDAGFWQNGQVLVSGRLDRQVKVRGVRIQPEEIEAKLKRFTDSSGNMPVKACLVVPSTHEPIELTAFMETSKGASLDISAVLGFLRQELTKVYLPDHLVHLQEGLPRTASGKPDQPALRRMATDLIDGVKDGAATAAGVDAAGSADNSGTIRGIPQGSSSAVLGEGREIEGGAFAWDIDLRSPLWKFVLDHKYKSEPLFPGSGYVSLAAEAVAALWPGTEWELCDLVFKKPLPLMSPRQLRVTATMTTTKDVTKDACACMISITSAAPGGRESDWTEHCTCQGALQANTASASTPQPPATAGMGEEGVLAYPVDELYAQLADGGFDYGFQFQALRAAYVAKSSGNAAGATGSKCCGEVAHRQGSPFLLDPVTMDACFQLSPLVSALGFQGAPSSVRRVRRLGSPPEAAMLLQVDVSASLDGSISFSSECEGCVMFSLEGLELTAFDSLPPEVVGIVQEDYLGIESVTSAASAGSTTSVDTLLPRVLVVGQDAWQDGIKFANEVGITESELELVCAEEGLAGTTAVARVSTKAAAIVVRNIESEQVGARAAAVESLLLMLGSDLPFQGRVWLVVVGDGDVWQCAGRAWAAKYPGLMLSILDLQEIGPGSCTAVFDPDAPPFLSAGRFAKLIALEAPTTRLSASTRMFAGVSLHEESIVVVMSLVVSPLTAAVVRALRDIGVSADLILPPQASASKKADVDASTVIYCAVNQDDPSSSSCAALQWIEEACVASVQCVTVCCMAALLPSARHSAGACTSARAAGASRRRSEAGHTSRVVYAPPLMDGLWFDPPAPAGFHRCTVQSFVVALAGAASSGDSVVGLPDSSIAKTAKHWTSVMQHGGGAGSTGTRTREELREFLLLELSSSLGVEVDAIDEDTGIEELGISSLATLRLSQRLRRFLQREFSAFALQNSPTVTELVSALNDVQETGDDGTSRGVVLCLHGFRTSSVILQQQMLPLAAILSRMGYKLLVPDGPHASTGQAENAAGLDEGETYGWWLYDGDSHHSKPLGLEESVKYLQGVVPADTTIAGVVGFSQGGAMAAHVANTFGASWALLFSPVYVPGQPAQCSCPTFVAFDSTDDVMEATSALLGELPAGTQQLQHEHGHRLPPSSEQEWWSLVAHFLEGLVGGTTV